VPVPEEKSLPTLAAELWDLVRAYAKQETVEPLKGLARWVGFGVAGSLLLGIGGVLLLLASLRALQTESGDLFDGNWSFVPYLIVLLGCVALVAWSATRITRKDER
jgi:predicted Co/Zn/Cd cation transporter (cation efflux family)